jgi:hypothetical protein
MTDTRTNYVSLANNDVFQVRNVAEKLIKACKFLSQLVDT